MTSREYVRALRKFNLSVIGAAAVFGISHRQSQRYASGTPLPSPLRKLIRIMVKRRIPAKQVEKL